MLRRSLPVIPLTATSAPVVAALDLGAVRRMLSPESERESTSGESPSSGSSLSRIWSSSVPTLSRMSLVPLHNTRQDKALIDIVTKCYYTKPRSASVVHAHRGARKSYVAQRCAERSKLFFFNPFAIGIAYIDAKSMDAATLEKTIAAEISYTRYVIEFGRTAIFIVAVAVVLALVRRWWRKDKNENTKEETWFQMIWRTVWEELPTEATILVFVAGVALRLLRRYRRVIIVDDPVGRPSTTSNQKDLVAAQSLLDRLDGTAHGVPMVILTSNDGIGMCFTDKNSSVRAYLSFPSPKLEELPDVLRDAAANPREPFPQLAAMDITAIEAAARHNVEHHALSVRWWLGLARHAAKNGAKQLDAATIGRLSRDRSFLWHTVLFLDCECSAVFRPECLGFSQPLTDEQKMTVAKLVLPLDATDEQLRELVKRLPAKCPRRLAFAWALVLTATSGDVEHVESGLRTALADIPEPTFGRPQNPYQVFIVPLVKAIDDFMAQQTAARSANTASPNENEKAVKAEGTKQSPTTRRRKSPKK